MKKQLNNHLDRLQNELITFLKQHHPDTHEEKIYKDLLFSVELIREGNFDLYELRLLSVAFKELRHAFKIFKKYHARPKVAVFGSARTPRDHPDYLQAVKFGKLLARKRWMTITGGASGIMEAAIVGAGAKNSFGLNIRLPFEQDANTVIKGSEKLMFFKYFFTRKLMFLKESQATVLFPGGFGTFDEAFESLTLVQTGKANPRPIIMVDPPGSLYWKTLTSALKNSMEHEGWISPGDLGLISHYQDPQLAVDEIVKFYSNYDSARFYKDQYMLRLRKRPTTAAMKRINKEFKDVVSKGTIKIAGSSVKDDNKGSKYTRLIFHFNRSHYARLRKLIDTLNDL
ncbi:MAG: hypothetical protein ACI9CF_001741 [Candidatus Omnitrophota bacterium]|jgi:uncharacterized protein (TIGR00730 family)